MKTIESRLLLAIAVFALLAATGCATFFSPNRQTSSLLDYLYPNDQSHKDKPQAATLTLPLRVGVAFVPVDPARKRTRLDYELSEQQKLALLQQVSTNFAKYPFVKRIEVIPSAYLSPRGGFDNLEQLQKMFGVDIVALVSYDQIQFTGNSKWSISYLTVIGAYLINGEENDTRTMLDTAVYDIASRKLLFRAPGLSQVKGGASLVDHDEKMRQNSERGFAMASTNLTANLEAELLRFPERIKEQPEDVKIVRSPGYVSAGAFGAVEILSLAALALGALTHRKRSK